jgi:hypothetical protein
MLGTTIGALKPQRVPHAQLRQDGSDHFLRQTFQDTEPSARDAWGRQLWKGGVARPERVGEDIAQTIYTNERCVPHRLFFFAPRFGLFAPGFPIHQPAFLQQMR